MSEIRHDDKDPPQKPASNDTLFFRDKSATINDATDGIEVTTASGIVERGLEDNGISAQNLVSTNTNPTANDDGAGTLGIVHQINDLWTNTATSSAYICVDNTANNAV